MQEKPPRLRPLRSAQRAAAGKTRGLSGQSARTDEEYRTQHNALLSTQAELETSRARYAELYDAAPVGYVTLNRAGIVEEVNLMGAQLLGATRPHVIVHPLMVFIAKHDRKKFMQFLSQLRRRPGRDSVQVELERKDGANVLVDLIVTPSIAREEGRMQFQCALIDITARRQVESDLRASEDKFRTLASHAPVGIFLSDSNGDLAYINETWCKLTDFPADRALGRGWLGAVHPEDRERVSAGWDESVRNGVAADTEFRFLRPEGETVWVQGKAAPLKSAAGEFTGFIGTIADITAQKQAELELASAHRQVLAASRAKDDFLAMLSHELRTPLNPALLTASEAARNPELPPRVRTDFDAIRKNIELEARLIDDMLDITRISRGKLLLNLEPVNVHDILQDAIAKVRADMDLKKIAVIPRLNAPMPSVSGDPVRLQQIFWNVLKNAVKFTPVEGSISVETEMAGPQLTVKITDNGIGMSEEDIGSVFEPFSQRAATGYGGLGLGLAITRRLIELHHGTIEAASDGKGRGATFTIALPLTRQPKRVSAPKKLPAGQLPLLLPEKRPAHGLRILLVEDHEPTRSALVRLLMNRHFKVDAAGSLAEARELAGKRDFNLLISDIGLPDGNGCDLMEEFHQSHPVPGIALTGYGMEEDVSRSHAAGFMTHLTKPVRVELLDTALATALRAK